MIKFVAKDNPSGQINLANQGRPPSKHLKRCRLDENAVKSPHHVKEGESANGERSRESSQLPCGSNGPRGPPAASARPGNQASSSLENPRTRRIPFPAHRELPARRGHLFSLRIFPGSG